MVTKENRTTQDAVFVTHSDKCAGMIGAATSEVHQGQRLHQPHKQAVHMTASADHKISSQIVLAIEGPSTHDKDCYIGEVCMR